MTLVEVEKMKNLNLNKSVDINILLLGEAGVGKSTFINSIAHYFSYANLEEAEKENLITLIPTLFNIQDKNGKFHNIKTGTKDLNEYLETGESATQDVKTYVFPISLGETNANVRLIDTPGMGDTNGIMRDDINCENILNYIGQLNELHAICFLFKPTNTRLTKFFGYCMSQILSRLDKTASKNIIFIFTNTRGTDYGPGETFPILERMVKDIRSKPPNAFIPLDRNIFCFDNEVFRYLAATKLGVEFTDFVKRRIKESWEISMAQCWGLIRYIVGDSKNAPLNPHFMKSTSAINEARKMIVQLSQPLADITQNINDNLFALQRHEKDLNINNTSLEDLKKKLYMPIIALNVVKLSHPATVCTSDTCAEIYKVNDINKWHYKQRCHDPCYLENVRAECIGTPELTNCAAMDSANKCTECKYNCDFSVHMHIYYTTETKEDQVVDSNVQKGIVNKEQVLQQANKIIADITQKKTELEKERDIVVNACARFAHFLQNNAITPFNDFYKEYIDYLIVRERSLGGAANMDIIKQLQKLLREYQEAKNSFDRALEYQKNLKSDECVTPQNIHETIQELYKLKHYGKKIRELYECQKNSRRKEYQQTEYVHNVTLVRSNASARQKSQQKLQQNNTASTSCTALTPQTSAANQSSPKPHSQHDNTSENIAADSISHTYLRLQ